MAVLALKLQQETRKTVLGMTRIKNGYKILSGKTEGKTLLQNAGLQYADWICVRHAIRK
jgi:hypothetical protein